MPEEIKKAIILCVAPGDAAHLGRQADAGVLPGLSRMAAEGAWASGVAGPSEPAAALASLATGSTPDTHGVAGSGDACRAEYLWEAAQRSSKRSVLFGFAPDRPPAGAEETPALEAGAVWTYLLTSPDWDICLLYLESGEGSAEARAEKVDGAVSRMLGVADGETLSVVVGLPGGEGAGFAALMGSGVRQGARLERGVGLEDLVPTLCYLAEMSVPADCEGGILYQALEDPDMKIKELRACRRNYERLRRSSGPGVMC